jgi:hypothetical protein
MKGVLSEYTDGSASKSKHPADMPLYLFVSNIELSNQVPACHGASRFRHQVGVAQDTVDREPSRGQVQHGGRLDLLANLALLITTHSVRCASCQPPGNLLAGEIQRLDSEAATPMDPDLLHPSRMQQM